MILLLCIFDGTDIVVENPRDNLTDSEINSFIEFANELLIETGFDKRIVGFKWEG